MTTDKHLLSEIKRELDWAFEEVKRTESEVRRLECDFNKEMENASPEENKRLNAEKSKLQERVGLHEAYALQHRAATRFATLCRAFDIASVSETADIIRERLGLFMYRAIDGEPANADQKDKLLEFAEALMAYFADGHSDEADEAIREAWQNIEETLRELNRTS